MTSKGHILYPPNQREHERLRDVKLRFFAGLASHWDLKLDEQMALLGLFDRELLESVFLRQNFPDAVNISSDVLVRIELLISIYGALVRLVSREHTMTWVRTPISGAPFCGLSALEIMSGEDRGGLEKIARYLLAEVNS